MSGRQITDPSIEEAAPSEDSLLLYRDEVTNKSRKTRYGSGAGKIPRNDDLLSTAAGKGASMVRFQDGAAVQAMQADKGIRSDLNSADEGKGASLVRFEDDTTVQALQADKGIRADLASTDADKGAELVARLQADSMFALCSLATPSTAKFGIELRAFYSDTGTGGGRFYWDADRDKADANGGTIIDPDNVGTLSATALGTFLTQQGTGSGTGCWARVHGGVLNVEAYGARGDGTQIDTKAFAAFFADTAAHELHGDPSATYVIDARVKPTSNKRLLGNGATITVDNSSDFNLIETGVNNGDGARNVRISGWKFINVFSAGGIGDTRRCISFGDNSSDIEIDNNSFTDFYWDLHVRSQSSGNPPNKNEDDSERVPKRVHHHHNNHSRSLGVSVFLFKGVEDSIIEHNTLDRSGDGPDNIGQPVLIDAYSGSETDPSVSRACKNITVRNNKISNSLSGGIVCSSCQKVWIHDNDLSNIGSLNSGDNSSSAAIVFGKDAPGTPDPSECFIFRNNLVNIHQVGINVSGNSVHVNYNRVKDAGLSGKGDSWITLGSASHAWKNGTAGHNTIERGSGPNIDTFVLKGAGTGENSIVGPNNYIGVTAAESRYLAFKNSAVREPTLRTMFQGNKSGANSDRPSPAITGERYYDEGHRRPVYWNGSGWRDAGGGFTTGNVADDSATSFVLGQNYGEIAITDTGASGTHYAGKAVFKAASNSRILDCGSTANLDFSTGALAGTDGVDGNVTVSVNNTDGMVYIENRSGSTKVFFVRVW